MIKEQHYFDNEQLKNFEAEDIEIKKLTRIVDIKKCMRACNKMKLMISANKERY